MLPVEVMFNHLWGCVMLPVEVMFYHLWGCVMLPVEHVSCYLLRSCFISCEVVSCYLLSVCHFTCWGYVISLVRLCYVACFGFVACYTICCYQLVVSLYQCEVMLTLCLACLHWGSMVYVKSFWIFLPVRMCFYQCNDVLSSVKTVMLLVCRSCFFYVSICNSVIVRNNQWSMFLVSLPCKQFH